MNHEACIGLRLTSFEISRISNLWLWFCVCLSVCVFCHQHLWSPESLGPEKSLLFIVSGSGELSFLPRIYILLKAPKSKPQRSQSWLGLTGFLTWRRAVLRGVSLEPSLERPSSPGGLSAPLLRSSAGGAARSLCTLHPSTQHCLLPPLPQHCLLPQEPRGCLGLLG